jgi:DNA polymerase V
MKSNAAKIEDLQVINELLDLNKELIKNPIATFFFRVSGDQMKGAGIYDGNLIIVDRSLDCFDKNIVIAEIDGAFEIKRYRENNGDPYLVAEDNPHSAVDLSSSEVEIWGVAIYAIHSY